MTRSIWLLQFLALYSLNYIEYAMLALQLALLGDFVSALTVLSNLLNPLVIYVHPNK